MTEMIQVRLLRDYFLATGGRLMPGAQTEFPKSEAEWLISKGIAELHEYASPEDECEELIELVRQRAPMVRDPVRHPYELDFERYVAWCREHRELAMPPNVDTILRYAVHRLHSDHVKLATVERGVLGVTTIAALAAGSGATGGGGHVANEVRHALNAVMRDAKIKARERRPAVYEPTTEEAAPFAFEIVEARAAERLGIPKKINGKANGHASAA